MCLEDIVFNFVSFSRLYETQWNGEQICSAKKTEQKIKTRNNT